MIDFTNFRLGSLWVNKSNNKLYRLRRLTDPKTLQGTLYMWCPDDSDRLFDLVFNEWEPTP